MQETSVPAAEFQGLEEGGARPGARVSVGWLVFGCSISRLMIERENYFLFFAEMRGKAIHTPWM